ncbi:MAG: excinuclease ABC subunit UvrA, partial [Lentisphaeria bacterium]|nr:excinuclease ABC subunit UvrA [Lentisphaeria bacterium]NQZ67279.1 excinuclease ABC subunit UvrA [Lentisphaeria bacterium]
MAKKKIIESKSIKITGARQHNLKNIDVEIPRYELVVITGPSGSGKSSLAFDTLYAEGQRRYVESLSAYARQFLDQMQKPEVDHIEGLSPAIAIEQRSAGGSPRSIVATTTEIYDYLRLLYAHIGKPHCPDCGKAMKGQSAQQICDHIMAQPEGAKMMLLSPYAQGKKGEHVDTLEQIRKDGFVRVRIDGEIKSLDDTDIKLKKTFKHNIEAVVDRLVTGKLDQTRLIDSVERSLKCSGGLIVVLIENGDSWDEELISEHLACAACGYSMGELQPRNFSFNSPYGACNSCHGLGAMNIVDEKLILEPHKILDTAVPLLMKGPRRLIRYHKNVMGCVADHYGVNTSTKFQDIPKSVQQVLLHGSGDEDIIFAFRWGGRQYRAVKPFEGIIPMLNRRYRETESPSMKDRLKKVMRQHPCPKCEGKRLRRESLGVLVHGQSIADFIALSVEKAYDFASNLELIGEEKIIASEILKEVCSRLEFLLSVGLSYLNLNRESGSLSGGEAQRIRLATQVGSGLTGVLYVLDEPSIGLHQRDNVKLLNTLKKLRDVGNTVVVVEHDLETILTADYVIDIGPGAGVHGGEIVAQGTPAKIKRSGKSLTAAYLQGKLKIEVPETRHEGIGKKIRIEGAAMNNLKKVNVDIPLGTFCCVSGVSGSGKSSLINGILSKAVQRHFDIGTSVPGPHKRITGLEYIDKMIV